MVIKGDDGVIYVEVDCTHVHSTDFAVLLNNGDREEWFPKAILQDCPELGQTGTAIIVEHWAIKKNFI